MSLGGKDKEVALEARIYIVWSVADREKTCASVLKWER